MRINSKKLIISLFLLPLWGAGGHCQDLDTYLQIASENNPKVQSAYTEFEATLEQSPQVSSLPDPTLTVSAFGRMIETRLGAQEARFSLMQMFPWFGTLKAKSETADLMAEAKFQEYLSRRNEIHLEVKKAYARLYEIEKTIHLKRENLKILDSYRELALSKFKSGSSKMVNVVKIDINREEAITEIELLEEELESLERQFNILLNRGEENPVEVQDSLRFDTEHLAELQKEDAFKDHPELTRFDREAEAYRNEGELSKKEGLPMLGLGVDYSVISERTDANPPRNGQDAIMPMFSISLPIFRKKYKAARREAELRETAAVQNREAKENQLKSSLEETRYELSKAEKLVDLYERQLEKTNQANRLEISAFSNDTGEFEEVLQLNQDVLMLKTEKIKAIKEGFIAMANLEYLSFKTENYDENTTN